MIVEILTLFLAIPVGVLIAWMARDELIDGRKWFYGTMIVSAVFGTGFAVKGYGEITLTFWFIAIVSFVSIIKSRDKRWTKKKI